MLMENIPADLVKVAVVKANCLHYTNNIHQDLGIWWSQPDTYSNSCQLEHHNHHICPQVLQSHDNSGFLVPDWNKKPSTRDYLQRDKSAVSRKNKEVTPVYILTHFKGLRMDNCAFLT